MSAVATPKKSSNAPRIIAAVVLGFWSFSLLAPSVLCVLLMVAGIGRVDADFGETVRWLSTRFFGDEVLSHLPFAMLLLGLVLLGAMLLVLLRPRRLLLPLTAGETRTASGAAPATAANTAANGQNTAKSTVDSPCETGDSPQVTVASNGHKLDENIPVRTYHTRVMAATFAEGGNRQGAIAMCAVGDILSLSTKDTESGTSVVLFRTVTGTTLGLMDATLTRTIRESYPGHNIGAVIERIEGGAGRPYTAHVAVTVYRRPEPRTKGTGKHRGRRKGSKGTASGQ